MPTITLAQSAREIEQLIDHADAAAKERDWATAVDRWHAVLAHPCAHHQVLADEVWEEIHQNLRSCGRWDDAIAAKRHAIAAGWRSEPDADADIADILLQAGRREEADRLYAQLRDRDPDDVWLYDQASYAYRRLDPAVALRWALDGIDVAVRTGDGDRVVGQLLLAVREHSDTLAMPVDQAVVDRVDAFNAEWTPTSLHEPRWDPAPPHEDQPCDHCGYDPAARPDLPEPAPSSTSMPWPSPSRPPVELAVGWFPAEEWTVALTRWPHLLDGRPEDHQDYSRGIEGHVKLLAARLAGQRPHVASMTVDGLVDYAATNGKDVGQASTRASYAAELLGTSHALRWPPERNASCWCRSGRKYKKCCGPAPAQELSS